jgi:hypothetical protein
MSVNGTIFLRNFPNPRLNRIKPITDKVTNRENSLHALYNDISRSLD